MFANCLMVAVIVAIFLSLIFVARGALYRYMDLLNDVILALEYVEDDTERWYIVETFGGFLVFLAEKDFVQKLVTKTTEKREEYKCGKRYGRSVVKAMHYFNEDGLSLNLYSYRGRIYVSEMLEKETVIWQLTDDPSKRTKTWVRVYLYPITKKVYVCLGSHYYQVGGPDLYDAIKTYGFTLKAFLKGNLKLPDETKEKVCSYAVARDAIINQPSDIGSLQKRFSYTHWMASAEDYAELLKLTDQYFQEVTANGYRYAFVSDYRGDRWPIAMCAVE